MSEQKKLSNAFIDEIFALSLKENDIFLVCKQYLLYSYFPNEAYKKIWKYILNYYTNNSKTPTIGILSQSFVNDEPIQQFLADVKNLKLPEKHDFLIAFEEFIIDSKFISHYDEIGELYNQGEKEKAIEKAKKFNEEMNKFTIRGELYEKIFRGFNKRQQERLLKNNSESSIELGNKRIMFGIDELDNITGGIRQDEGDIVLFLARAKTGKSTLGRFIGVQNSRRGKKMLHIQLEGSKREAVDFYDASFTAISYNDIELGNISEDKMKKIQNIIDKIGDGEIFVHANEEIRGCSWADIEIVYDDIEKEHGKIDGIILDYLELTQTADGKLYKVNEERFRRKAIINWFKNFCVKKKSAGITFMQAESIEREILNDEKFVMTRENVSEVKSIVDPVTYFISLNQTADEYENDIMRLYMDASRKTKGNKLVRIATGFKYHKFYDRKRTLQLFGET